MKTLVTGTTGFLGSAVARELLVSGRAVRVLVRRGSDLRNLQGLDVEVVHGDLRDPESLARALDKCDALYHAAAYYSLWSRDRKMMYDINVAGTRNILHAAQQAGLERVVYTSTVGCIGLSSNGGSGTETTPFNPATLCNDYKRSKYEAEQVALEFANNGLPLVIVNPSAPVGPRDIKPTPTGKVIQDFLNGNMPAYLDTGLNLIDVRDCARGHLLAEERGTPGERYILGNRNMSLKEILDTLSNITGIPAPKVQMPYWVAYSAGWVCDAVSDYITHKPPAVPLGGVKMAKYHMYFDASKAVQELGLPQNPVEQALSDAVHWMREHGLAR
ncbi:hopanoid-associated sugar epimerase [Nitrospina watsonii]|uniref:Dihydroflavonol 4-reductase n=1 Tax=Nitrospina watsonii TaxID=1323948 RepID=A0ABN8VWD9_9BACT|nr:hopanoid-associated sugar epimerase [Nitrospina watsonii]CAI2717262.1 Putative dihydroflavonol 4-reductase [Nitrospina watsonii]